MKKVLATEKSTGGNRTVFPGSERRRLRIRIRPASIDPATGALQARTSLPRRSSP